MDTVIPLEVAAKRLNLDIAILTRLVQNGTIEAVKLPTGEMMVNQQQAQNAIVKEKFDHLRGTPITVADAEKKYKVGRQTIRAWVRRELIKVITPGYSMELDEADIAYCAAVYYARNGRAGVRLFDEHGKPYKIKYPGLARARRKNKK